MVQWVRGGGRETTGAVRGGMPGGTWGSLSLGHELALGARSGLCSDCSCGSLLGCPLKPTWLLESLIVKVKCSRLFNTDHGYTDLQFK